MKKLLVYIFIFTMQTINTCNLCRDFVYTGQVLRRTTREIVNCNCSCRPSVRVKFVDGYGCAECGHRSIPEDIFQTKPRTTDIENPTWDPASKQKIRYYENDPQDKRVLIGEIS
ncbi:MAG TPA: hypothetical protein VLG50_01310 [Candidatus Saccharimonadales bacterium]|nr:hypothetical protein [Candidatus Saccharimonadales bacterium]